MKITVAGINRTLYREEVQLVAAGSKKTHGDLINEALRLLKAVRESKERGK